MIDTDKKDTNILDVINKNPQMCENIAIAFAIAISVVALIVGMTVYHVYAEYYKAEAIKTEMLKTTTTHTISEHKPFFGETDQKHKVSIRVSRE